jgi:hypothetical protein
VASSPVSESTRIIDLARNGLIDPTALPDRVIAEARLSE